MMLKFIIALSASIAAFIFSYHLYADNIKLSNTAKITTEKAIAFLEKGSKKNGLRPGVDIKNFERRLNRIRGYLQSAQNGKPFGNASRILHWLLIAINSLAGLGYLGAACFAWQAGNKYRLSMKSAFTSAAAACIIYFFFVRNQLGFTVNLYFEMQSAVKFLAGTTPLPYADDFGFSTMPLDLWALIMALQMSFFVLFAPGLAYYLIRQKENKKIHV